MRKSFYVAIGIGLILVGYITFVVIDVRKNGHAVNLKKSKEYYWLFKDSFINQVEAKFSYSYVKDRDIYTNFNFRRDSLSRDFDYDYKTDINIVIWEFKDLKFASLDNMFIQDSSIFYYTKYRDYEILDSDCDTKTIMKYGAKFSKSIIVKFDNQSKVVSHFENGNYKGFYGNIHALTLCNELEESQIIIRNDEGNKYTIFLFYKSEKGFYVILLTSYLPIDMKMLEILNLQ